MSKIQKLKRFSDFVVSESYYGNNAWVGPDYFDPGPSMPVGMDVARISINGRVISNMTAYDPHLSNMALTWAKQDIVNGEILATNILTNILMGGTKYHNYTEPTNVIVKRIMPSQDDLYVDVFITFDINDNNYFGILKNFGSVNAFFDSAAQNLMRDREDKMRLINFFKSIIKKWMAIPAGKYVLVGNDIQAFDVVGRVIQIKSGNLLNVVSSSMEDMTVKINTEYGQCTLRRPYYYYLNYWLQDATKTLSS